VIQQLSPIAPIGMIKKIFLDKLKKKRMKAIVEYIDYQVPVTQLKGPKGPCLQQGEIEMRHHPRSQYMVMWAVDRFKRYAR